MKFIKKKLEDIDKLEVLFIGICIGFLLGTLFFEFTGGQFL